MGDCAFYFEPLGIPFEPEYEDIAVHAVRSDPYLTLADKKDLIICWFLNSEGNWNGLRYNRGNTSQAMHAWLVRNNYKSYEEFLDEYAANST